MEWPADLPDDCAFVELPAPAVCSELDLEHLLKSTEEKLNLNASSIEQQLKELQAKLGDVHTGERPLSPSDFFHLFNVRAHASVRPVTTGHQELMDFLRALQHYLRSEEEGKEQATLQLLVDVSVQCGVCFPCSSSSPLHPQQTSVHAAKDDSSLEVLEAWDNVRVQLRRHLLDRLSSCSPDKNISSLSISERVQCLQQLLFLYTESEALTYYQSLRSKSVQALIHSALSCSPGAETGFDRLALAFGAVVPALSQAIAEELHVLTRLAESHTVLGFLNAAYLSTVARELTSLVEREREAALRDNTTVSSKIKKYSARSRAAVAPVEPPASNRSFSLTSHQLKALTQLACTLLGLESHVKELVTNVNSIDCTGDAPCVKGILKKRRAHSDGMTGPKTSAAETLPRTPEAHAVEFDWRSAFRGLAPHMQHCVKVVLDDVCAKSLQQEEDSHSAGRASIALSPTAGRASSPRLREDSFYAVSERETPKMIAKFCGSVLAQLDALLPLAAACGGGGLAEVQSSFVEACGRAAFAMLGRLQERALEVPSSAPLRNLPALLSSCLYAHQRLEHYHARLKDSNTSAAKVPLTLLPVQKYQDTAVALKEQLTSYCVQVCLTCILQDAESHHWADPKPFYEGERCSFSLQMWFYFLCGLRSDLWAILPAQSAREVLGQVLSETLRLLVQRYARARPSYNRHMQIRCDITLVLLYVEQLVWSLCESPEALIRPSGSSAAVIITGKTDWTYQIHCLCEQLLTVLVIGTAPLSLLYRMFVLNPAPHEPDVPVSHWLNVVDPDLFTEQAIADGPAGCAAFRCQLRLLTSDPGLHPKLLLRMLLHGDCHLPRALLENSHLCQGSDFKVSAEARKAGDDFIVSLFNLFSCLSNAPKALTQALRPYMERAHMWEHLYTLADTTRAAPVLISCVRATLTKCTNSLLVHLVTMVMDHHIAEEPSRASFRRNVPERVLAKIPKEWNYTPPEGRGQGTPTKTVVPLAIQAISFIFTNLPSAVASVPLTVRHLFHVAEVRLTQHTRQLRVVGLLPWAMLGCLIQGLEDPDALEQVSGQALGRRAKDLLSLLAECLQAAMGVQQKGVPKPTVHKVLQLLEEHRPKWINVQLQKARKLCSDSVFEQRKESGVAAAELTEQKIGLMLLEVCHKAGGSDYLRQIYHIIQGNEELLMSKASGGADSPGDPRLVNFAPDNSGRAEAARFDPLRQFDHIGKKRLDQSAVAAWAWDWPGLLPGYRGISRVTFRTLLANRTSPARPPPPLPLHRRRHPSMHRNEQ
ncbi:uncharacterized protein KIAA0825 homolog isoform X2 [Betta splendens]|uniref:Uncharacterized protein KIAA0825 homolog isoform X2 n=1 Tax=Betta splendens TaxID=158456 RepID=A0A9W2XZM3_BETSP|nr:uncharacterized protein KIAA0825 homolog isoform X2 [Betta splendens]